MENNSIETLKVHVGLENIETKLFKNIDGKFCVRSRDLDAEENITIIKCKSLEQAEEYYQKYVKAN